MPDHEMPLALTFDDVLLVPGRSEVLPNDVETETWLSRHIRLNIPIVSAAMDTVTEGRLAIAMAQQGGIGIIHRNMPIDKQAGEIDKVKRSESGMIVDPITVAPEARISDALQIMSHYRISGVPVTAGDGKLLGILTNRDLRFETRLDVSVRERMTSKNLITVPVGTTLEQAKALLHEHRIEKLLVVDDDFHLKGLITVKDIQKAIEYPRACKDQFGRLRVGAALGTASDALERAAAMVEAKADLLVIDTAHGHSANVIRMVQEVKKKFPDLDIMAGNIATREAAEELIGAGADALKVGVGPGSICTTRIVAGAGVPQLTAIQGVAQAAARHHIPIVADGGIKYSGDITKALAAGAQSVMIGGLFAGVDESPGETILFQGRTFKEYRGMGSIGAMNRGSADRYGQAGERDERKLVPEGIEGRVPHKGSLGALIHQLVGGLRSGMGYCGCKDIATLQQKARFVRITHAGLRESHVHDVIITKEAPNYKIE